MIFKILIGKFRDFKLRTKLILSYIFLIALPTVIIGFSYYNTSAKIILEGTQQNLQEIVKKNNDIINIKLNQIQESALRLILDKDLYSVFSNIKPNDDYELLKTDKQVSQILDKYFSQYEDVYSTYIVTSYFRFGKTVLSKGNEFSKTRLYSSALKHEGKLQWVPTYNLKDMFGISRSEDLGINYPNMFSAVKQLNITSIETFGSFSQAWNSQTAFEMKTLDSKIERPVLVVNFREDMLSKIFKESVKIDKSNYYIISSEGDVISSSISDDIAERIKPEWLKEIASQKDGVIYKTINGDRLIFTFDTLKTNGWISVVITPVKSILSTLPLVRYYTVYLGVGLTLISILLALIISGWIAKPLKKLLISIRRASEGDFNSIISVHSNDEISLLIRNFNVMNQKIQNLIEENYETKIREKEAHIMALNMQLNPHFMSNTLNTINWMALENNQKDISKMIVSLSTMLEYTMRNVKEIVCFEKDLEWLKCFVYIMSNRFPGLFTTEFDIDPRLDKQPVPKLFLQPFVENSIIHGFEVMENGGCIKICGRLEDNTICIRIEDNGKGMTEEEIMKAKNSDGDRIGISNINKKIKLIFGEDYGVDIESELGKGTAVTVTIPYKAM